VAWHPTSRLIRLVACAIFFSLLIQFHFLVMLSQSLVLDLFILNSLTETFFPLSIYYFPLSLVFRIPLP
jgi:hypothetical protein